MSTNQDSAVNHRLLSLDVMRGAVILGMIIVNSAAYVYYVAQLPIAPWFLHANWSGFLFADWVFPAFIVIVGVSIPLSLREFRKSGGVDRKVYERILGRSIKLILLGIFLSNIYRWFNEIDLSQMRFFGVLQRIGIVYCATAFIYLYASRLFMAGLVCAILAAYWLLVNMPVPGGDVTDLSIAGANFVSWVDRSALGDHAFIKTPLGYDPEGILSTFPVVAQCLIGVLLGMRIGAQQVSRGLVVKVFGAGILMCLTGIALSSALPIIKDLWTSSYVLVTTGLTFMLFASALWAVDIVGYHRFPIGVLRVFGVNAIAAYTLHHLLSFILVSAPMIGSYEIMSGLVPGWVAALAPVVIFIWIIWLAMNWLWKNKIVIKI